MNFGKIKNFLLEIFFPKICLNCQREGDWLCQDCLATLEILNLHQKHSTQNLKDLYFALPYQKSLIKKLIQKFKYPPFIKELSQALASIIINHFQLLDNPSMTTSALRFQRGNFAERAEVALLGNVENFPACIGYAEGIAGRSEYILIPLPLGKKRLKWRGFNQAEEMGRHLSFYFKIPLLSNVLIKIKETYPQIDLSEKERRENIRGVFLVKNPEIIKGRKILLLDDVYTTGSTMEECARILKESGAKEIIGIAVARASPGQDRFQNI